MESSVPCAATVSDGIAAAKLPAMRPRRRLRGLTLLALVLALLPLGFVNDYVADVAVLIAPTPSVATTSAASGGQPSRVVSSALPYAPRAKKPAWPRLIWPA